MQHLLHQIKAQQFYTDLDLYQQCNALQKIEKFKDFSRHLSDFPVFFKAYLIFKDFSRQSSKFKYFSSLCEPCYTYCTSPCLMQSFIWRIESQSGSKSNWLVAFSVRKNTMNVTICQILTITVDVVKFRTLFSFRSQTHAHVICWLPGLEPKLLKNNDQEGIIHL